MNKILCLIVLLFTSCAHNTTSNVDYTIDQTTFKGYVATPKKLKKDEKRPAVLVVHEWWGQNEYARQRADMLAQEGYVAMALDMYGEGQTVENPTDAGKLSGAVYADMAAAKRRFAKALEVLRARSDVDATKVAAIGYCFGGGIVLHMAREGMDLDGVISYHGSLKPAGAKATKGKVKAQVLAFNGAADPMVPKREVDAFKVEMKKAGVTFQSVDYAGALHAFTNPMATEVGQKWNLPVAYDEKADKDSWQKSLAFFKKIFN
jgi:dienelactone hydrolase